jgi:tetratricopeptide (TPR) repeat protein
LKTLQAVLQERQQQECPPVVTLQEHPSYGGKPMLQFKWKKKWLLIAAVAMVLTGASLYNFGQGYQIMRSEGPKAALTFFQNRGETYDSLFGKAWALYRNGEYEEAKKLGNRVLQSSTLKDQARANYLLGELHTLSGDYETAREYLLTAHAMYESRGVDVSLFRTQLALAKLSLTQKELENADYYLNLASFREKSESDQIYLYLRSQLAFFYHDYEKALELTLEQEKMVGSDSSQLAGILSDIGFYFGLVGNMEKCLSYTVKAQGLASRQENGLAQMYNNINMCLFLKCSKRDYSQLREIIVAHAYGTKDMKLLEQIYFVDKFSCPIPQTNPGHLDPPDDPPPTPPSQNAHPQDPSFQGAMKSNQE